MIIKDLILNKAWEAQLTMLVAGKKCWVRFVKKWLLKNRPQEVVGSLIPIQLLLEMTPPGFPHTMLSVKRVKHNMRLAFIKKLFTNCEIRTSMQTKYLRFKGMLYKSESYLCDISYVQLQKALAQFRCDNSQQCQVRGRACHTLRGFVEAAIWGRLRMKNTCSLFVQIHKKSRNAFIQPYLSPTLALLLSSCKL